MNLVITRDEFSLVDENAIMIMKQRLNVLAHPSHYRMSIYFEESVQFVTWFAYVTDERTLHAKLCLLMYNFLSHVGI